MMRPRTLRGRLLIALMLVFLAALGVSTAFDHAARKGAAPTDAMDQEPYQDGLVLAAFSVPALALIWFVSSWSLRPLIRASAEARRAGPGDPLARISRTGLPAEIFPLVEAVNGALDRMAAAIETERRFTENAAHELRTPLAVLKLRLERARARASGFDWPAIDHDLAQMQRLVSQLLDLARKEHAGVAAQGPVNLARLAREAAAMIAPLAEAQRRVLVVEAEEALAATGHADDVRDAIRNLLENALLHGAGTMTLRVWQDGAHAVVEVTDDGGGIAPALRERVFERFGKGAATAGSGLGLAIVREVARAHGGAAWVADGSGCRVRLAIAAGPPASPRIG